MLLESLILDTLKSSVGMSPICRLYPRTLFVVFFLLLDFSQKTPREYPKKELGLSLLLCDEVTNIFCMFSWLPVSLYSVLSVEVVIFHQGRL